MSSNAGPRFRIDTLLSGPGWRWSLCSLRARLRDATLLMVGFIQGATSFVTMCDPVFLMCCDSIACFAISESR